MHIGNKFSILHSSFSLDMPKYSSMTSRNWGANQVEVSAGYWEEQDTVFGIRCLISLWCKWLLKTEILSSSVFDTPISIGCGPSLAYLCSPGCCSPEESPFTLSAPGFPLRQASTTEVDPRSCRAIGYHSGSNKAPNIHRGQPQKPWAAGSCGKLAEGLWHGQYTHTGGLWSMT